MIIKPTQADFTKWISCVPQDGDLLFLSDRGRDLFLQESIALSTKDEIKAQGLDLWPLNSRSWYGYALNRADYCVKLLRGHLEKLPPHMLNAVLEEQLKFGVPTIINERWITSQVWSELSQESQIQVVRDWAVQNEINEYESIELSSLPTTVKDELQRIEYDKLLNQFAGFSGPNCFAAAAGAIANENSLSIASKWMHWPTLEGLLGEQGYSISSSMPPEERDILIFQKDGQVIHAAYFLGEDFYFEKPGQDFYEPYRVAKFQNWQIEWPGSSLSLWRKY